MKTAYKWFDYFLNLLLISVVLSTVGFIYLAQNNFIFPDNSLAIKGAVITIAMLVVFVSGLLYILFGFSIFIVNRKRNPERAKFGKKLFLNGLLKSVLSFMIFFILSLALSFFGLSEPSCLCLPKISNLDSQNATQDTPQFPTSDLIILNKKSYPPEVSGDNWTCDLTIENKNASMSAVHITFDTAYLWRTSNDTIPAGSTKVINVSADNSSSNACNNISITAAEMLNPDTSPIPSLSSSPSQ